MDASTSVPIANKKRHYCSVCSNYRGKSVDNKTIILHKFPADESLKKSWIRCIKILMPQFAYIKHDRLLMAKQLKTTCCSEQISLIFNDYLGAVEEKDMCRSLQKDIKTYPITVDCHEIGVQTVSEPLVTTVGTQTDDNHCSCQTDGKLVMQVASSTDIQIKQTKSIGIQVIRPDIAFEDISDSNEKCMFYTGIPDPNTIRLLSDTLNDA
ncbi:hypothetical protein ACJMK2_008439 [Sinanodonta woodiana]|uniref:THAP-type domain-containing protein n=1 Tax=Sinanodonta woodiana TaxID=1069815 RepID=A0ABD3VLL9_SINWO